MSQNSSRAAGRHFLQIPGPTPVPDRILRAMDTPVIDHRGPEFAEARQARARRHQDHLQDHQSGDHLHRDRHRRLGSRAGQHAVARRQRADGRDRPVRHAVEEHGREARPQAGIHRDRLAHRRRSGRDRSASCARTRTTRSRRSASLHNETSTGCALADRRDPQGDRCGRAPGAADGRHHLVARLDRLSPRRMGRRRHGRRLAEGPDAAARHVVQRASATRRSPAVEDLEAAEVVLVVGRHARA